MRVRFATEHSHNAIATAAMEASHNPFPMDDGWRRGRGGGGDSSRYLSVAGFGSQLQSSSPSMWPSLLCTKPCRLDAGRSSMLGEDQGDCHWPDWVPSLHHKAHVSGMADPHRARWAWWARSRAGSIFQFQSSTLSPRRRSYVRVLAVVLGPSRHVKYRVPILDLRCALYDVY